MGDICSGIPFRRIPPFIYVLRERERERESVGISTCSERGMESEVSQTGGLTFALLEVMLEWETVAVEDS